MSPPSGFFETVTFSLTYPEIPWLDLRGMINFPGMVTHVTHQLRGDPKTRCSFRILNRIENRRPAIINFCYVWLKRHSCVYVQGCYTLIIYFYLGWFWGSKWNENCKRKFCSARNLFTNVTLSDSNMSHIRDRSFITSKGGGGGGQKRGG